MYGFYRSVTIDHTKVPNTDQTNFPVLISITLASFKTVGNGGNVQNANGYDLIFSSTTSSADKLDHEIESYSATTGKIEFWVRIPSLSHTVDTVFYCLYGNSSISTSQENINSVWSSVYGLVDHLVDGTTITYKDSSGNSETGVGDGGNPTAAAGFIDGGIQTSGGSLVRFPSGSSLDTIPGSWSLWFKTSVNLALSFPIIFVRADTNSKSGLTVGFLTTTGGIYINAQDGSGTVLNISDITGSHADGNWHLIHVCFDTNSGATFGYIDGTQVVTGTATSTWAFGAFEFKVSRSSDSFFASTDGLWDEVRVAKSKLSADWVKTEWNNQNSPSTFHTFGSETAASATFNLSLSDQLALSDSILSLLALRIQFTGDQIVLSDQANIDHVGSLNFVDTLTLNDSILLGLSRALSLSDQLILSDLLKIASQNRYAFNDALSLLDSLSSTLGLTGRISDSLNSWAEAIRSSIQVGREVGDFFNLNDAIKLFRTNTPKFSDQIFLFDSSKVVLGISIGLTDQLVLSDLLTTNPTTQIRLSLNDQLILVDALGSVSASTAKTNYLRRYLNDDKIDPNPEPPLPDV